MASKFINFDVVENIFQKLSIKRMYPHDWYSEHAHKIAYWDWFSKIFHLNVTLQYSLSIYTHTQPTNTCIYILLHNVIHAWEILVESRSSFILLLVESRSFFYYYLRIEDMNLCTYVATLIKIVNVLNCITQNY